MQSAACMQGVSFCPCGHAKLRPLQQFLQLSAGTLPGTWGQMAMLRHLDVSANNFSGTLPPNWTQMPALTSLNVSATFLEGPLPLNIWLSPNLTVLDFSWNLLTGACFQRGVDVQMPPRRPFSRCLARLWKESLPLKTWLSSSNMLVESR